MLSNDDAEVTQEIATRELARFFAVARTRRTASTMMPVCPVDAFWHEFQTQRDALLVAPGEGAIMAAPEGAMAPLVEGSERVRTGRISLAI